jgi:hypothetical protein
MMQPECFGKDRREVQGKAGRFPEVWLTMLGAWLCLSCSKPITSARDAADANDTGRTLAARTEAERTVLLKLATLPDNSPQRVGDLTIVAEPRYDAASGRTCRAVHLKSAAPSGSNDRLACTDGGPWFFVPSVFAASTAE